MKYPTESNMFTDIGLNVNTLDLFAVRKAIFNALNERMKEFGPKHLDVGCGQMPYREYILEHSSVRDYIGLDFKAGIYADRKKPDITWDGKRIPLDDNSVDSAMATEVLEHCPEPSLVLEEIHRVLKPGGVFFFTVPFLWPLHDVPYDEYRYTPFAMERLLKQAGFSEIELNALGGWDTSLAQMLGLWLRRRPMTPRQRKWLSMFLLPAYRFLLKKDVVPCDFKKPVMITGLSAICRKGQA